MKIVYTNATDNLFKKGLVRLEFTGTEEEVLAVADAVDLSLHFSQVSRAGVFEAVTKR